MAIFHNDNVIVIHKLLLSGSIQRKFHMQYSIPLPVLLITICVYFNDKDQAMIGWRNSGLQINLEKNDGL